MNDLLPLSLSWLAGAVLGAFFFGGLWWTVRRVARSTRPGLLVLGSFLLRSSAALVGLYFVAAGGVWERILTCFFGFLTARFVVTRVTRRLDPPRVAQWEDAAHASESR